MPHISDDDFTLLNVLAKIAVNTLNNKDICTSDSNSDARSVKIPPDFIETIDNLIERMQLYRTQSNNGQIREPQSEYNTNIKSIIEWLEGI